MRNLLVAALISSLPAAAGAQGIVTITAGFRGPAGPAYNETRAGPLFGIDVKPVRWGWGALGIELSHAPRNTETDSGAVNPPGLMCYGPDGVLTTCASSRAIAGEATSQLGVIVRFGSERPRFAPFADLGFGYYRTSQLARIDIWDPTGRLLSNLSGSQTDTEGGIYARGGIGVEVKPWAKGPALSLSGRYRWAKRGDGFDAWTEWFNDRKGTEVVVGVRF